MKMFSKVLASVLAASAALSVTAFAADYGYYGDYDGDDDDKYEYDEPDVFDEDTGLSPADPTDTVTGDMISAALKGDGIVYITSDAVLKEDAVGEIAKSGKPVTSVCNSYSITIDPAMIKTVKAIDLSMNVGVSLSLVKVDGVEVPVGAIVIAPAQKGDFGMTLEVTIDASNAKQLNAKNTSLYYIDDFGNVTKLDSDIKVNADGSISVFLSHASKYVVSDVDIRPVNDGKPSNSDETKTDSDKSNVGEPANGNSETNSNNDSKTDGSENPNTGVTVFGLLAVAAVSGAVVTTTAKKRK